MRVDLHLHSTASDGGLPPGAVVRAARAGRLDVIAIADHDTAAGIPEAEAEARRIGGVRVVRAIEVSSTHGGTDLHVLGYAIDPLAAPLVAYQRRASTRRTERVHGMLGRLAELGVEVAFDDVLAETGGGSISLGRPHLARALVAAGHARSVADAFDRYLGDGGPAFLPTELLTPREAIELVRSAGGLPVWAHPSIALLEQEARRFRGWGLAGLECYRPGLPATDSARIEHHAGKLDLLLTGGSDWHGPWHGDLGQFSAPLNRLAPFLDRIAIHPVTTDAAPSR